MTELITTEELLKQVERETQPAALKRRKSVINPHRKALGQLVRTVKRYADAVQLKMAVTRGNLFVPHLRIVVEPASYKGVELPLQGPWLFDLTRKAVPLKDFSSQWTWRTMTDKEFMLEPPRADIKRAFERCLTEARHKLQRTFFESTILARVSEDQDEVVNANYQHLLAVAHASQRMLDEQHHKLRTPFLKRIDGCKSKIRRLKVRIRRFKLSKLYKEKVRKRHVPVPAEIKEAKASVKRLQREITGCRDELQRLKQECVNQKQAVVDECFAEAHKRVKKRIYKPTAQDMIVHATIMLVPKRKSRV